MVVVGKGFCDALRFHEYEACAVGKGVAFVGVLAEINCGTLERVVIGGQADVSAACVEKIEHAEDDAAGAAAEGLDELARLKGGRLPERFDDLDHGVAIEDAAT